MHILKTVGFVLTITAVMSFAIMNTNWNINPNFSIKFSGSKAAGTFSGLAGKIHFNPNDLMHSLIDVTVDANTIKTGNSTKDRHAKGEDWFYVAKYPIIKFTSQSKQNSI